MKHELLYDEHFSSSPWPSGTSPEIQRLKMQLSLYTYSLPPTLQLLCPVLNETLATRNLPAIFSRERGSVSVCVCVCLSIQECVRTALVIDKGRNKEAFVSNLRSATYPALPQSSPFLFTLPPVGPKTLCHP